MKKIFVNLIIALLFCSLITYAQGTIWGTNQYGGSSGGGVLFKVNFDGTNYQKVKDFTLDIPGNNPSARLVAGPSPSFNTKLFGTTGQGGIYYGGVIFKYDPASGSYTRVYDFTQSSGRYPLGSMVLYNNKFYGLTSSGGASDGGVVFSFDPTSGTYTKEADFNSSTTGSTPNGYLTLYNNKFYGTTSAGGANNAGVLFEFDPTKSAGLNLTNKYDFATGSSPKGELVVSGSLIYGVTSAGGANNLGTIFEFDPSASVGSNYMKKVDFDATTGSTPTVGMTLVSSNLYGVTYAGGANSKGTIFQYAPGATSITVKADIPAYPFSGILPSGTMLYTNNLLYGNNSYSMFSYDPTQSGPASFKTVAVYDYNNTGVDAQGGFSQGFDGKLYGLTWFGGVAQAGSIIKYDPAQPTDSSNPIATVSFNTSSGSFSPNDLLYLNGKLYGHTYIGDGNRGSIYEYDPVGGAFNDKGFDNFPQGNFPSPPTAANGNLYGLIGNSVYEYEPSNHTIVNKAVSNSMNALGFTLASNGLLYGISTYGGANNTGYIIEYDPVGNAMTKKLDFESTFNSTVVSSFLQASNGLLYAVAHQGGANGKGYLIEYAAGASSVTKKYDFETGDNDYYIHGLVACTANGKLYGVRLKGGANKRGSIFEYTLPTTDVPNGVVKEVYSFPATGPGLPQNTLVESGNGKLYGGLGEGGNTSEGVLFEYDPIHNIYSDKTSFTSTQGTTTSSMVVIPDSQTITFNGLTPYPYGSVLKPASASSGLPIAYSSSNTNVAITQGDSIIVVGVGTATITASQPGNGGYLAATPVQQTLITVKASQAITFLSLTNKKSNEAPLMLNATSSSNLTVTYTSSNAAVATISGNTVTIVGRGSTNIQASQAGNDNYNAAVPVTQALTIVNTPPTVTNAISNQEAHQLGSFTFTFANNVFVDFDGDAMTYTATRYNGSGLPSWLTFTASTQTFSGTPSVNDTTVTIHLIANDGHGGTVTNSFKIHIKVYQTITFSSLSSKKLNEAPFTLNATASSNLAVAYSSSNPAVATISGNTVTIVGRGSTDIQASQAGNDNYNAAVPVTQTLTVVNTPPTVANAIADQDALQLSSFTFSFASNVFVDLDGDVLTYTAARYNGSDLPSWLTFNAATRTFSGTPGVADTTTAIHLNANDGNGGTATSSFKIRIKIITGIETIANTQIKIYPNPVHHTLTVENESGDISPIIIRSSLGEIIYQGEQNTRHEISVLPWASGLYFVEVRQGDAIIQRKIIKY